MRLYFRIILPIEPQTNYPEIVPLCFEHARIKGHFKGTPAHCLPDETSLDSKDSCDSARLTLLRQQVELAEQEMRRESAKAKRVEITLQAEQRARVDAEVRCEQVRKGRLLSVEFCSKFYGSSPEIPEVFATVLWCSLK